MIQSGISVTEQKAGLGGRSGSIRARLTIVVLALLLATTIVGGAVAWWGCRAFLLDGVDDRLLGARARPPVDSGLPPAQADPSGRPVAVLRFSADGRLIEARPSGAVQRPDPFPGLDAAARQAGVNRIRTVSAPGSPGYRYLAARRPDGGLTLLVVPLDDVARILRRLIWCVAGVGALLTAVGSLAGWWLVGRGLSPIDRLVRTAAAVRPDHLGTRVGSMAHGGEVRRLAAVFDGMLERLDTAFAERELAHRQLERFVADASHELRTPLTAVHGYAELCQRRPLPPGPLLDHALTRIRRETARMIRLVDDLQLLADLDHRRATRQLAPTEVAAFELTGIVEELAADHRLLGGAGAIIVRAQSGVAVHADEDQLRRVVTNLLANVRAHTPAGDGGHRVHRAARPGR